MEKKLPPMAKRLEGTESNVWVEIGDLAVETNTLELGQGNQYFFPPAIDLKETLNTDNSQIHTYTRSFGHLRLVKALADLYSLKFERKIDPLKEVLVTVGAYASLFSAHQGIINPGDEVIIIEPFFDCYKPMVQQAGGIPVFVPLRPTKTGSILSSDDWKLDPDELRSKFNARTKAIIVNNPNNPLGKVFKKDELELISELCKQYNVFVFADEVYEWIVYKPNQHIRIATLPGMWERTITIGSAGKTFNVTGWRLGWTIGPEHLVRALCTIHQNSNYACSTLLQEALAVTFEKELKQLNSPQSYFEQLTKELQPKRDRMVKFISDVGFVPTLPEGGYFLSADFSHIDFEFDENSKEPRDFQFVKWMMKTKKVGPIPSSAFYSDDHKHLAANMVRFCFFKNESTMDEAEKIFSHWMKTL